jgi:hypothetical protein
VKRWKRLSPSIEEIIETIKNLELKDALAYLVAIKFVFDVSKKGYEKVKKIIQDKHNEGKYAFVPDKEEANRLLEFGKDPSFRQVLMLVPNYRYIDIIRTGLLIVYYHKNDTPKNRERTKNIRLQIDRRPNGKKLLKIVTLPDTAFFSIILRYLYELKTEGYSETFLEETLDQIVQEWEETSKLVRREDSKQSVVSFCEKQVEAKNESFYVIGMKTASKTVEEALEELKKERYSQRMAILLN